MVTDRRGFLAAIAGVLLVGRGAIEKLRELAKERYEDWNFTPVDFMESTTVHCIGDGMLRELQRSASRYVHPGMRLTLEKAEDRPGIIGRVSEEQGWISAEFFISLAKPYAVNQAMYPRYVLRQVKYQTIKCADAVAFAVRTGWTSSFVDAPGNSLHGRIFYRHIMSGRVQFKRPEAA